MLADAAPKELPKKRVKSRGKLAEPSQRPLESSSEEDVVSDGSEYLPVKMEVERPRSSSKKTRKTRDSTTKSKRTKVHDFKSSSEDEELGIVRKPRKVEKTPALHKKAEDKISHKKPEREIIERPRRSGASSLPKPNLAPVDSLPGPSSAITNPRVGLRKQTEQEYVVSRVEVEQMDTCQLPGSSKKEEPDVAGFLFEAAEFENPNASSNPAKLARRKKKVDAFVNNTFKACPTFAKPAQIKSTKLFNLQECDEIISVLEDMLKLVEVGVAVPPPTPPSPSSESQTESDSEPELNKERDTEIGSRETESTEPDIMDAMKAFMTMLSS